jgi:hypothetical protein
MELRVKEVESRSSNQMERANDKIQRLEETNSELTKVNFDLWRKAKMVELTANSPFKNIQNNSEESKGIFL